MKIKPALVGSIWLYKTGGEAGPQHVKVDIEVQPGVWVNLIEECADGNFSHDVTSDGIRAAIARSDQFSCPRCADATCEECLENWGDEPHDPFEGMNPGTLGP